MFREPPKPLNRSGQVRPRALKQLADASAAQPLGLSNIHQVSTEAGATLTPRPLPFMLAQLGTLTGKKYAWTQMQDNGDGTFAVLAGGATDAGGTLPAYERSGNLDVPAGTTVELELADSGDHYLFSFDASTALALVRVSSDSPLSTDVAGLYLGNLITEAALDFKTPTETLGAQVWLYDLDGTTLNSGSAYLAYNTGDSMQATSVSGVHSLPLYIVCDDGPDASHTVRGWVNLHDQTMGQGIKTFSSKVVVNADKLSSLGGPLIVNSDNSDAHHANWQAEINGYNLLFQSNYGLMHFDTGVAGGKMRLQGVDMFVDIGQGVVDNVGSALYIDSNIGGNVLYIQVQQPLVGAPDAPFGNWFYPTGTIYAVNPIAVPSDSGLGPPFNPTLFGLTARIVIGTKTLHIVNGIAVDYS